MGAGGTGEAAAGTAPLHPETTGATQAQCDSEAHVILVQHVSGCSFPLLPMNIRCAHMCKATRTILGIGLVSTSLAS
jgi:hypothetical protein